MCSATGPDLVVGKAVEAVADEVELVVEVSGPGAVTRQRVGEGLEESRRAVLGDEIVRAREVGRIDAPLGLPADEAADDVADRVGDVRVRELRLELAVLGVLEHDPTARDGLAACARS